MSKSVKENVADYFDIIGKIFNADLASIWERFSENPIVAFHQLGATSENYDSHTLYINGMLAGALLAQMAASPEWDELLADARKTYLSDRGLV